MRLLFICTGNMCRSPLAERLTSSWAHDALGAQAAGISVRSAGTDAQPGRAMEARSARALVDLGGDPTGFVARELVRTEAEDADLVLTMTRRHRNKVIKGAPRAMRWTFTLAEAAALIPLADTEGITALPLPERAAALAERLNAARSRRVSDVQDDVQDPIGQPQSVHSDVARQIADCLEPLTELLFAPVPAPRDLRPPMQAGPSTVARPLMLPPLPPPRPVGRHRALADR
jgi:protein-tyrosine phosphatase